MLTPEELTLIAKRMVDSNDPTEVEELKSVLLAGFYCETADVGIPSK